MLTTDDRKRLLRARRGADEHIQRVADLATKHNLSLPNVPLAGIANDVKLEQQLAPIEEELRVARQIAEDAGIKAFVSSRRLRMLDGAPRLRTLLESPEPQDRIVAAHTLGLAGQTSLERALARLLDDVDLNSNAMMKSRTPRDET